MNEQLQAWLLVTLQQVTDTTKRIADFAAGELPKFVQEFLTFNLIWNWCVAIFCFLFIAILVVPFFYSLFKADKNKYDWEFKYIVVGFSVIIPSFIIFVVGMEALYKALLVTFAPRVFLLTEFMKFFK